MANRKHLAKLNEGVEAWNRWRKQKSVKADRGTTGDGFQNVAQFHPLVSLSEDQGGRRGRVVSDSDGFSYPELEG